MNCSKLSKNDIILSILGEAISITTEKGSENQMKFEFMNLLLNPLMLMFFSIGSGLIFGKVKFGKFKFGTSGALFTGLVIGYFIQGLALKIVKTGDGANGYIAATKLIKTGIIEKDFLELALIFFVAAIGLLAAKDMAVVIKKYGPKFVALAIIITFVGAISSFGAMKLLPDQSPYVFSGVYVGALTSSPGLGAALETADNHSEDTANAYEKSNLATKQHILDSVAGKGKLDAKNVPTLSALQKKDYITKSSGSVATGYAIAYPFGVIIVIFAVSFFAIIFRMDLEEEKRRYKNEMDEARSMCKVRDIPVKSFDIITLAITCVVGYLVGSINIYLGPLGYFSLGATGGILIMALILGSIGKIGPLCFRMDPKVLSIVRELSLAFFLCIVGLKYGYVAIGAVLGSGLLLVIVALVVGILSMLVGFIVGRYVFKLNWVMLAGAICGGMTSTPGLGAAVDALESDDPAAGYGATYPFALLCMIIFTILLNKLPMF